MILAINTGSTSLKYKIFSGDLNEISAGRFEGLKSDKSFRNAFIKLSDGLSQMHRSENKLEVICHRFVHGGDLKSPYLINDKTVRNLKSCQKLAPLHNPIALKIILLAKKHFPKTRQIAIFDNAFYYNLPEISKILPIPLSIASKECLKKFGFHGISHQYVADQLDPGKSSKIISIHLGAGCSITAIKCGLPIETSMSYTPMDGLVMQTRSGAIDPGIVIHLTRRYGVNNAELILEKMSGLAGMTGTNGDMKTLLYYAGYPVDDEKFNASHTDIPSKIQKDLAKIAIDKFVYEIKKQIGAYNLILGGADILAFTGEIGYKSKIIRDLVTDGVDLLKNVKIVTVAPNEELAMARLVQ